MMKLLNNKKILLGICGGIAAYKVLSLIRLLKKDGAEVRVIMTPSAVEFIGKLTAATLADSPVYSELADPDSGQWTNHVELGLWADLFLVAPATASTLSKMASGMSDNLLLTTYLSARCPVFVAPAMDLDMWAHPATQKNLQILRQQKVSVLEPNEGELASGLSGKGRMQEPEEIFSALSGFYSQKQILKGKNVLITLGPTQEALDPVRFISNHSTGKMGAEIAKAFLEMGAGVTIVAGPVDKNLLPSEARILHVRSAIDMLDACELNFSQSDVIVLAAAVADYRPAQVSEQKIKKSGEHLSIELVKNPDIAATLGAKKRKDQFVLGFALETENELENAHAKRIRKNLDAIVLNSLNDSGAGFALDTNKITLISADGIAHPFETKSKKDVAHDITRFVVQQIQNL
jgi:phosphopantothenoylcysteine decarboxylase/phosphopantothenate--cysteine ligase